MPTNSQMFTHVANMKKLTIMLLVLAGPSFGFGALASGVVSDKGHFSAKLRMQEQSKEVSNLASKADSNRVVAGVNLQRTRVYPTKALHIPTSLSWETRKIFGMQYIAHSGFSTEMYGVDPTTGINRTGLQGSYSFYNYAYATGFDFSDPIIADGVVYFEFYIGDGYLVAIDIGATKEKWTFKLNRERFSEPAIAGGTIFTGASNGIFYALDAKTGKEKWVFKNDDRGYAVSSPLVDEAVVFFGSVNGNYYAVDAATGKVNWTYKTKKLLSPAAISEDLVYFGAGGELLALDRKTGQKKWGLDLKAAGSPPVIANETVYFQHANFLHAVDAKSGQPKWTTELRVRENWLIDHKTLHVFQYVSSLNAVTNMAVAEGTIYLGWQDKFYAFDELTGKQKWEFEVGAPMRSPVVAEDVVYFGSYGKLFALAAKTGVKLWTIATTDLIKDKTHTYVPSSPAVLNGQIYYVSDDGKVYAIR